MISPNKQQCKFNQHARIEHVEITSGPGKGNELLYIFNGELFFEVNVSRGFDIRACYYKGNMVNWLSPISHVSPSSYSPEKDEWNRGFEGGLLTTCGLEHAGQVEEKYGLHGRYSYSEAEIQEKRISHEAIHLKGMVREVKVGEHHYQLSRSIVSPLKESKIIITDIITNCGYLSSPLMLIYHINWGNPFLDDVSTALDDLGSCHFFKGSNPKTLDCRFSELEVGTIEVSTCDFANLFDRKVRLTWQHGNIRTSLHYDRTQLPFLSRWRFKGNEDDVVAWEPGTVSTRGHGYHEQADSLQYLAPSEQVEFSLIFEFSERKE